MKILNVVTTTREEAYGTRFDELTLPKQVNASVSIEASPGIPPFLIVRVSWLVGNFISHPGRVNEGLYYNLEDLYEKVKVISELEQRTIPASENDPGRHFGVLTKDHIPFFLQKIDQSASDVQMLLHGYVGGYEILPEKNSLSQTIYGDLILPEGVENPYSIQAEHTVVMNTAPSMGIYKSLWFYELDDIEASRFSVIKAQVEKYLTYDFLFHWYTMIPERKDIAQKYFDLSLESRSRVKSAILMGQNVTKTYRAY